jgi:hypothetical protein
MIIPVTRGHWEGRVNKIDLATFSKVQIHGL